MEEALGADGHGFLEQHDALIGLVVEELPGGEAAGCRHVEMLPAARGYDEAFCCAHVGVLPCGGLRINVGTMNINADVVAVLQEVRGERGRRVGGVPRLASHRRSSSGTSQYRKSRDPLRPPPP